MSGVVSVSLCAFSTVGAFSFVANSSFAVKASISGVAYVSLCAFSTVGALPFAANISFAVKTSISGVVSISFSAFSTVGALSFVANSSFAVKTSFSGGTAPVLSSMLVSLFALSFKQGPNSTDFKSVEFKYASDPFIVACVPDISSRSVDASLMAEATIFWITVANELFFGLDIPRTSQVVSPS